MFVETKREGEAATDAWSVPGLVAWLEFQPGYKTYCYLDTGNCLIGKYLKFCGWENPNVGSNDACDGSGQRVRFPDGWEDISHGHPRTFGAALERARAALSGGKG